METTELVRRDVGLEMRVRLCGPRERDGGGGREAFPEGEVEGKGLGDVHWVVIWHKADLEMSC